MCSSCSSAGGIWKTWAPLRIKVFLWLVIRGRVWTDDRLAKRGLPHQDACCFYHCAQETIHHLFVGCLVVRMIWSLVLQWANLNEAIPLSTLSLQDWWQNARSRIQGNKSKTLSSLVHLIIWSIWRERNARVFDKHCTPLQTIIDLVKYDATQWEVAILGRQTLN